MKLTKEGGKEEFVIQNEVLRRELIPRPRSLLNLYFTNFYKMLNAVNTTSVLYYIYVNKIYTLYTQISEVVQLSFYLLISLIILTLLIFNLTT